MQKINLTSQEGENGGNTNNIKKKSKLGWSIETFLEMEE